MVRRAVAVVVGGLAGVALLASCSTAPAPRASSAPVPARPAAAPPYEVRTGTVPGLGTVLVDGQGMTLYLFEPDERSGRSTCYGLCAVEWPPLLLPAAVRAPAAGPGVRASRLGTTARRGGAVQVTYAGWPLYRWGRDTAPGEATGQGLANLGGTWYVLSPSGAPIVTAG